MSTAKGKSGEYYAEKYLVSRGFTLLNRNFHSQWGEIDLIVEYEGTIRFVEVKAYRADSMVSPLEMITTAKQDRIIKTAEFFLSINGLEEKNLQFDIIIIGNKTVQEHIEGAFYVQ